MNKEKTLEQLEIAKQIISDGLEWEYITNSKIWFKGNGNPLSCIVQNVEIRIKLQPDKFAELKKAHAEGKTIEYRIDETDPWDPIQNPCWECSGEYRIKPELIKVPIGPNDVPPGSVLYYKTWGSTDKVAWVNVIQITKSNGILVAETNPKWYSFKNLMEQFEINRSIPLTGKWNPESWEPCYKEVEQ